MSDSLKKTSDSLIFGEQPKWFAQSLIFGEQPEWFAHSCSIVMSDLSNLLTSLFKKEGMSEWPMFLKTYKNNFYKPYIKYDFNQIVVTKSLVFCEQKSE